jgi:hypothetical protein
VASVEDKEFYPICFLADVFNCLTCAWFDWDTGSGRCRNHGSDICKLSAGKPDPNSLGGTIYQ